MPTEELQYQWRSQDDRVARAHYGHVTTGAARMAHVSSRESAQSEKTFFRPTLFVLSYQ